MDQGIPGGAAAIAAFDALFDRWQNHSVDAFAKGLRIFVGKWGWQSIFPPDQKALFCNRAAGYFIAVHSIAYANYRWAQVSEAQYPFIVLRGGGNLECMADHANLDGLVLPHTHPFWSLSGPPFRYGCGCYIIAAQSRESSHRMGGQCDVMLPANWQDGLPLRRIIDLSRRDVLADVIRGTFDL